MTRTASIRLILTSFVFAWWFCPAVGADPVPYEPAGSRWFLHAGTSALVPLSDMNASFGVGPAATLGAGRVFEQFTFRGNATYRALQCTASDSLGNDLSGTVHQTGICAEVILPGLLITDRGYIIGGLGLAYRKLREGRVIRRMYITRHGLPASSVRHLGYDDPFVDVTARLGAGVCLWNTGRWKLNAECVYETDFALWGDTEIKYDLRTDESIHAGLQLQMNL